MSISFEKAKEISIAKWTGVVNDTTPVFDLDENVLLDLKRHYNCGFCLRYGFEGISESVSKEACTKCEFGEIAGICTNDASLYSKYTFYDDDCGDNQCKEKAIEVATKILEIIINLKEKEEC